MSLLSPLQAALFWSSFQILTRDRVQALRDVFGSLEVAATHLDEPLLRKLGCRDDTIQRVLATKKNVDPAAMEAELVQKGIRFLILGQREYPARLADIPDAPPFLYVRGNPAVLAEPGIALVGTRRMSLYGKRATEHFVSAFVRAGVVTVSGLARGVDTVVAEETIASGGKTIAVLGHGLEHPSPSHHRRRAEKIVEAGGAVVSEFPLRFPPEPYTFPARNRIVAGMSIATLVLEAPLGSGALITARLASEYGREVYAVPGQIFDAGYEGCHEFLANRKASVASSPRQLLQDLGFVPSSSAPPAYVARTPDEAALLAILHAMPQPIDDLVARSGLPPATVASSLTLLELAGGARNLGGGVWVRS